ncbi:MAG TPA: hypothetical protein VGA21_00500 [Cyclobacteriaceae bacterium]|jgi:hypothetical protein
MKTGKLLIVIIFLIGQACLDGNNFNEAVTGKTGSITRFAVKGDYLYSLDMNQILVFEIFDNGETEQVNAVPADYGLETIIIYDETIYVGSTSALYILDISVPATPVILSKLDREEILIGGCDPVVVKDNYAYSTVKIIENRCGRLSAVSQLIVYDVSDKKNPFEVNTFPMDQPNGLGYKDNHLFVCDQGVDKIQIFDITVPTNPAYIGFVNLVDPIDLIPNGETMIVSTANDFVIYDITDVNNITRLSSIPKK